MEHTLWSHLPLLVRTNSKESVEYILQALWRTRKTGLDPADRGVIRDMLQLQNESDLDPLLVCLRMLIRRCVYDNVKKEEIQQLFPSEVLPELQRLLALLLHRFQREWRDDAVKDKLLNDSQSRTRESEVRFELANDALETTLNSMYSIRDQLSDAGEASNDHLSQDANML